MPHADDQTVRYATAATNDCVRAAQSSDVPIDERMIWSNIAIARAIQEVGEKLDRALACYTIDVNRVNE